MTNTHPNSIFNFVFKRHILPAALPSPPIAFKMSVAETVNSARKIELGKVCENIFLRVGILKIPRGDSYCQME